LHHLQLLGQVGLGKEAGCAKTGIIYQKSMVSPWACSALKIAAGAAGRSGRWQHGDSDAVSAGQCGGQVV